jgi:hypothetical protein
LSNLDEHNKAKRRNYNRRRLVHLSLFHKHRRLQRASLCSVDGIRGHVPSPMLVNRGRAKVLR